MRVRPILLFLFLISTQLIPLSVAADSDQGLEFRVVWKVPVEPELIYLGPVSEDLDSPIIAVRMMSSSFLMCTRFTVIDLTNRVVLANVTIPDVLLLNGNIVDDFDGDGYFELICGGLCFYDIYDSDCLLLFSLRNFRYAVLETWRFGLIPSMHARFASYDVDGDGAADLITKFYCEDDNTICIAALSVKRMEILWRVPLYQAYSLAVSDNPDFFYVLPLESFYFSYSVGDFDGDGDFDYIFFGYDFYIYVIDMGAGEIIFKKDLYEYYNAGQFVRAWGNFSDCWGVFKHIHRVIYTYDSDGDGRDELYIVQVSNIDPDVLTFGVLDDGDFRLIMNRTGLRWYPFVFPYDYDGDGVFEIYVSCGLDNDHDIFFIFDLSGNLVDEFVIYTPWPFLWSCIADLDGDDELEVFYISWYGSWTYSLRNGSFLYRIEPPVENVLSVSAMYDIDFDGYLEIMFTVLIDGRLYWVVCDVIGGGKRLFLDKSWSVYPFLGPTIWCHRLLDGDNDGLSAYTERVCLVLFARTFRFLVFSSLLVLSVVFVLLHIAVFVLRLLRNQRRIILATFGSIYAI